MEIDIGKIFASVPRATLKLNRDQLPVYRAITRCRTAALGGHRSRCTHCEHEEYNFNSCWNRHCPKCQGGETFAWVKEREKELLPVEYFHVVFTLPSEFRDLCYKNKKQIYTLLSTASQETLLQIAKDKGDITLGGFSVLHSWNQELQYHPHLHYCIPGGGLIPDGTWKKARRDGKFFLPVRILSAVFKGIFIKGLKELYPKLYVKDSELENPREFEHLISKAAAKPWSVYAKRPFAGTSAVLKYLASYTHRVAISNKRIVEVSDSTVSFLARDRFRKEKKKVVTVTKHHFVHSFLYHVLPKGFRRVRYFGFLANRTKAQKLEAIRALLGATSLPSEVVPPIAVSTESSSTSDLFCPKCKTGRLTLSVLYKPHKAAHARLLNNNIPSFPFCLDPPAAL